jgi:hypothetical protein
MAPASAATAGWSNAPSPWLRKFKRLLVRYERRADIHHALLALGGCLVCFRRLGALNLKWVLRPIGG